MDEDTLLCLNAWFMYHAFRHNDPTSNILKSVVECILHLIDGILGFRAYIREIYCSQGVATLVRSQAQNGPMACSVVIYVQLLRLGFLDPNTRMEITAKGDIRPLCAREQRCAPDSWLQYRSLIHSVNLKYASNKPKLWLGDESNENIPHFDQNKQS